MIARTRLPTFWPTRASSRPGIIWPPTIAGFVTKVLAFSEAFFPVQKYSTKFATRESVLVRTGPVPWMTVLTVSVLLAASFGILTVGVAPNAPVTVTFAFTFTVGVEVGTALGDPPQPARTRLARTGMTMRPRKRRIKNPQVYGSSAQTAYWGF